MGTEGGTKNVRYDASLGHCGRGKARCVLRLSPSCRCEEEDATAKAQRALAKFADI